jgi:hypothetical protein
MFIRRSLIAVLGVVMVVALGLVQGVVSAQSPKREDPVASPFYLREVFGTGEWSVIYFYRPPECVPRDFNLSLFFDVPRVFECAPMTVDAFAVWETGPRLDPFGPRQARARGLGAVPFWFVRTEDLRRVTRDDAYTIGDLEALDPLMGTARFFTEVLHPEGAAKNPLLVVNARGTLEDGRSFRVHISVTFGNEHRDEHRVTRISFGR